MGNVVLIVASGLGTRLNTAIPKQYLLLGGSSILKLTILKFLNHHKIDKIKVVIHEKHKELYDEAIKGIDDKLLPPSWGGEVRQDSVRNGLNDLIECGPEKVLIHDAARPFVSEEIISNVLKQLELYEAVDTGISVKDTLKSKNPTAIYNRDNFYLTHTPQGFNFKTILELHNKYKGKPFTDDIGLCIEEGINIGFVESNSQNIKITTKDCLTYARFIMQENYIVRVGYGFDIHKFREPKEKEYNTIKLCGINIPFDKSLSAHSDGDAALHAITDALLGAMGEEDIGMFFPPTDNKWKNADSTIFLNHAYKLLTEKGGVINNIDITIVIEKPKLMNYKNSMRKKIAELLRISNNQISVKAKTSEKMGFVGREEGISVSAVCLVMLPKS